MTQKLQQMRRAPRGIRLVSAWLLCGGSLTLLISIGIMLLGFALMAMIDEGKLLRDDEAAFSQMFGGGVLIFAGLAGIVLGLVTILAGFGLKRMKQWGLWSTYVVMALWLLVDALVLMFSGFSLAYLTIKLCVLIGLMLSIIIGIYLIRVRDCFN